MKSILVLALLMILPLSLAAQQRLETAVGLAYDKDSGELLYREEHFQRFEGDQIRQRQVLYRCPRGPVFARKQVDYRDSLFAPAFSMQDLRSGLREGLRRENGQAEVYIQRGGESRESAATLSAVNNLVADAGFDEFIRRNWDALQDGDRPRIQFVLTFRQSTAGFRVRKVGDEDIDGQPASTFRLSLSGVLGLFVSSIEASYHRETRALLRYEGVSNVRDVDGENYVTRIVFPAEERTEVENPEAFELAAALPLARDCNG